MTAGGAVRAGADDMDKQQQRRSTRARHAGRVIDITDAALQRRAAARGPGRTPSAAHVCQVVRQWRATRARLVLAGL